MTIFAMGSARDFLKQATSESHRLLDANPLVAGLVGGHLNSSLYSSMLQAYLNFFQPWETGLRTQHPALVEKIGPFRFEKTSWLHEDLAMLGISPTGSEKSHILLPTNSAELAGWLYVVEGSTLGGMHLSRKSGNLPGGASRFFEGYREETVPAWKTFIEWLDETLDDDRSRRLAAEAAIQVFSMFRKSFEQVITRTGTDSDC